MENHFKHSSLIWHTPIVLQKSTTISLRQRRSIESVLRHHPTAKIILLVAGNNGQNYELAMDEIKSQFEVFNQAGYNIRYLGCNSSSR